MYIHITTSFLHMQNTHHPCRHSAKLEIICISIKTKLRIKYSLKDRRTVMIETKASKYMYAQCTYTLQPHSYTCRTHINHVATQRDSKLSVLASRRSWESNIELQRRTVYDRFCDTFRNIKDKDVFKWDCRKIYNDRFLTINFDLCYTKSFKQ